MRTCFPQQETRVSPQFYRLHNSKKQIINSRQKNMTGAWFCQDCSATFEPECVKYSSVDKDDKGFSFETLADWRSEITLLINLKESQYFGS